MTQVKIFIEPLDRRVAAFEVGRVSSDRRTVARAVEAIRGPFNVAYYAVPVRSARKLSAVGGAR